MSKYTLVPGDIVDFTDTTTGNVHRGFIDRYEKGRDLFPLRTLDQKRDYFVKFDNNLWENGPSEAWCAKEDLELVRPTKTSSNVTFESSYTSTPLSKYDPNNIKINQKPNVQTSRPSNNEQPWTAYYMTASDFFDILKVAFEDTYGDDNHKWHPEDLYVNVSSVIEIVSNTLANSARLKSNKPLIGVKENLS